MVKILPPAVKNGQNMAPGVKYDQNFVSWGKKTIKILPPAVKNGLIILKNVAERGPQKKNASGPPGL